MKLLSVIPLAKSLPYDKLSYFSVKNVEPGTLVSVPLRSRNIEALVISSEDLSDMKQLLKSSEYKIRNIHKVHENQIYSPAFLKTAIGLSNYFLIKPGTLIESMTPSYVLKNIHDFSRKKVNSEKKVSQKILVQQSFDDLLTYMKSLSREQLNLQRSLHIICPTKDLVEKVYSEISKGISEKCHSLYGGLTQKKYRDAYEKIASSEGGVILVSTALFIDTSLHEKTDLVLFRDSHQAYASSDIQKIDTNIFIKKYAEELGCNLHILDTLLSVENWSKKDLPNTHLVEPFRKKIFSADNLQIFKLNETTKLKKTDSERIKEIEAKTTFSVFHPEIETIIEEAIKKGEKLFLYSQQKGLAPTIMCIRCGNLARSSESKLPYKLILKRDSMGNRKPYYICSASGECLDAFDQCQFCSSIALKPLGIGTTTIQKEIEEKFPGVAVRIIDGQHTKTATSIKKLLKEHDSEENSAILIGTKKALPFASHCDQSIIVTVDSLFSHSGYKIEEEFLSILQEASRAKNKKVLLQTRNIIEEQSSLISHGMYPEYINEEISLRKELLFPPFGTLILVEQTCKQELAQKLHTLMKEEFRENTKHIFTKNNKKSGHLSISMLLILESKDWNTEHQDRNLLSRLRNIEGSIKITINPGFFGI